jgi:adenylate cyclase
MRELLHADRATLFLVDEAKGELWSRLVDPPMEIRIPLSTGIAGHVARTGEPLNIDDPYSNPLFNRKIDDETGYKTRSLLCMPIVTSERRVFAVMQLLNKEGGPFTKEDETAFRDFVSGLSVILETWTHLKALAR